MITLYRFPYSCYVLKVQLLLDKLALPYLIKDVPFGDRTELVELTNGRVQVPVIEHALEDGSKKVVVESRDICRYLLGLKPNDLVPAGAEGLIWAFNDWADEILEDPLFKIVSPELADLFDRPADRAMFIFIKERKFGQGCVDRWGQEKPRLLRQIQELMEDTLLSIAHNGFIHSEKPTMADIALVGHLSMIKLAKEELIERIDPLLSNYMKKVYAH